MSHSTHLPPVHETSPPPFDDDETEENETVLHVENDGSASDELNNSNEDWKSADDETDAPVTRSEDDPVDTRNEHEIPGDDPQESAHDDGWANFAAFEQAEEDMSEVEAVLTLICIV